MANNKPNAIVLGGTNDHIALLRNLKGRGYHTTLIDYYDNPCAKPYADNFIQESTLNKEKVLEIAKNLEADLVISSCIDQALLTACYVAEKLNLPAPFDYQTALNVTNKRYMKEIFVKNDIPTSKHIVYDDNFDIGKSGLKFPLMVKPADSNGSYGVKKVNSIEKLDSYINYAKSISRTSNVVIEEFIDGLEISVDCFVKDKKAYVLLMSQLNKYNVGEDTMLIYQTITPPRISESIKEKISDTANKIVKAFNLDNTPLLIQ
jgi:phosphoribosylamine-glycine ligase